ncbi:MAG: hypothetical protein WCG99_03540 [Candidatus Berkelbacteria bacterium]
MTLIIGIKCKDGVVLASDGAATLGSLGNSTAKQPTKKLSVIDDKVIVGVSGPVGLGQRIIGEIDILWKDNAFSGNAPFQAMTKISEKIREHIRPELEMAASARNTVGQVALSSALSTTLVAMPVSRKPSLFQFDHQGSPEEAPDELPFASIGSGQAIADPFLGFIRRVFWNNETPTINEGLFASIWTLRHAIEINPGGVAEPIQVVILTQSGSNWIAKELCDSELQEHDDAVIAAEKRLSNLQEEVQSDEQAVAIPNPPN